MLSGRGIYVLKPLQLGEYTAAGGLIEETVWLNDLPVATLRPNGTGIGVYYVHADQLGAPRLVTRPADNAIMWRWDTEPFGTSAPNQNPQAQGTFVFNLRFPGQYYQAETGLNYNYFRDYDPHTGRYIESDPIGLAGGQASTYAYTDDNPVNWTDPSGRCPWCVAAGIGSIIGGSFNAYNNYADYKNGQISGEQYFNDIVIGVETGALAALPGLGGLGSGALIGGLASGSNEALQELENGCLSAKKIGLATTVGAAGSLLGPLGRAFGSRIPTSEIGNLVTAPRGYPDAGGLVGFALSAIASGLYP